MPLSPPREKRPPDSWQVYGHSYFMHNYGTRDNRGRADALLRAALDIEFTNWQNHAVTGSKVGGEGYMQGAAARYWQGFPLPRYGVDSAGTAPFVYYGGAKMICTGINDLGDGDSTRQRAMWTNWVRSVLAYFRASVFVDNNHSSVVYSVSPAWSAITSGGSRDYTISTTRLQRAGTVNSLFTFTIPATFTGGAVTFHFVTNSGAAGGTVTLSGTADMATKYINGVLGGTVVGLRDLTATALVHNAACVRVAGLTTANAGQTIVVTASTIDAGGFVDFDGVTIEAENPPPILFLNIARLTATGYAGYAGISANSVATNDGLVAAWNTISQAVIGEFDGMVQYVDIDTRIGGSAVYVATDGVHPNEKGAAQITDACLDALRKIFPNTPLGDTAQLNTPSSRWGGVLLPKRSGLWYTAEAPGGSGATYTAVAGEIFAIPYFETQPGAIINGWAVELAASTAAATVNFCIYDDRAAAGYPQTVHWNGVGGPLAGGGQALTIGAGSKQFAISPAIAIDPGLYWLVLQIRAIGTGTTFRTLRGPSLFLPRLATTGLMLPAAATIGGPMAWKIAGAGATNLPVVFAAGATLVDSPPTVGIKYQ